MSKETQYKVYQLLHWEEYRSGHEVGNRYKDRHKKRITYGALYTALRHLEDQGLLEIIMQKEKPRVRLFRKKAGGKRPPMPTSIDERTDEGWSPELAPTSSIVPENHMDLVGKLYK